MRADEMKLGWLVTYDQMLVSVWIDWAEYYKTSTNSDLKPEVIHFVYGKKCTGRIFNIWHIFLLAQ